MLLSIRPLIMFVLFSHACIRPKEKVDTSSSIDPSGISRIESNGLSIVIGENSDSISASYLTPAGPLGDRPPGAKRVDFVSKTKASDLLRLVGESGVCSGSTEKLVSHCGERPIAIFRNGSDESEIVYTEPTDCKHTYKWLCNDAGLTMMIQNIINEASK